MHKRILSGIFLMLFLSLTGWLIYAALRPEKLPVGSPMPALQYRTEKGLQYLSDDGPGNLILVHFHSQCGHCKYELELLDKNLPALSGTQIVLLTSEKDFFEKAKQAAWPHLATAKNVTWGMADKSAFADMFGSIATPVTFIFDQSDTLRAKIIGEAKLAKILIELKKTSGGPERRISGQ